MQSSQAFNTNNSLKDSNTLRLEKKLEDAQKQMLDALSRADRADSRYNKLNTSIKEANLLLNICTKAILPDTTECDSCSTKVIVPLSECRVELIARINTHLAINSNLIIRN